jgi:hypothetical protein
MNDYIATVIGMVRDDVDFSTLLSADLTYVGRSGIVAAAPAANNNNHFEQLETNNVRAGCAIVDPRHPVFRDGGRHDVARRG